MSHVQSVVFLRDSYTVGEAREWLRTHGYRNSKADVNTNTIRFRQVNPSDVYYYRTKVLPGVGISLIMGYPVRIG